MKVHLRDGFCYILNLIKFEGIWKGICHFGVFHKIFLIINTDKNLLVYALIYNIL